MNDWNKQIIEEFRANDGKVGGVFEGAPLLLLHDRGAKSGVERVHPVMCRAVGDGFAVFASKAGADTNPDWFLNLRAHPDVSVEVGTQEIAVTARVLDDAERAPIWEQQKAEFPNFAEYEAKTTRVIPVVMLEPR